VDCGETSKARFGVLDMANGEMGEENGGIIGADKDRGKGSLVLY
jgi:hypothetical protein